jgi:hypothetical protein
MRSRLPILLTTLAGILAGQDIRFQAPASVKVDLPKDAPLALVSSEPGESRATARGGAMVLDLHMTLTFRNVSGNGIRGLTLLVLAQEVTPGGKASVSVPSLNAGPNETVPVRVDLRVLRPLVRGEGPLVQVLLDGVLFDDLSFYGPNKLNSRRSMTAWELEARRDRQYFRGVLQAKGPEGLREEILASLALQARRSPISVRVAGKGRSTAVEPERQVRFAFLHVPGAPVEPVYGVAKAAGNAASFPVLEVENRSNRDVRYFELDWIIRDREGREFLAGTIPSAEAGQALKPGKKAVAAYTKSLEFATAGERPVSIEGMTSFVSLVEFADGGIWIPSRPFASDTRLRELGGASPEEERLTGLYKRKGLQTVIEELNRR